MQALKKQIKDKNIYGTYLFYGEERYVLQTYLDKMASVALGDGDPEMNKDVFDLSTTDMNRITDAMDTLPFLGERRIVILRNLDLFKSKNAAKAEKLLEALERLPDTTICFIVESEIDKRSKLYKRINTKGTVVEFKAQSEDELVKYIADKLNKRHKRIEIVAAKHMVHVVGDDLTMLTNELDKLADYMGEEPIVTTEAIDTICTRSIENRIFDLVDAMGTRQRERALRLYRDLIILKEPPTRILFMITRQFRLILQTKLLLEAKVDRQTMLTKLKVPPFVMDKNARQAKYFSVKQLQESMTKCLAAEADMKNGWLDLEMGLELLIVENSY